MEAGPSKDELDDINGRLFTLRVLYSLPQQIDKELKALLDNEDQQRELKEQQNGNTRTTNIR